MNNEKTSISLIGCCAIRDIFGLHNDDGGYEIKRYVQCVSPVSAMANSPLLRPLTDSDDALFGGAAHFFGRCQKLELEKRVFDYVAEDPADYLVVDAAEFRRKLFYFPENDSWFSENYNLSSMFQGYCDAGLIPSEYELRNPMELDLGFRKEILKEYCDRLLEMYVPERIILVEIKAGGHRQIDNEELCDDEEKTAAIFNERMSFSFDIVKECLCGAHVITFPQYVSIDPGHKWGRNLLHYYPEYYDYALNAVNLIVSKTLDVDEECERIERLKAECEERLYEESNNLRNL